MKLMFVSVCMRIVINIFTNQIYNKSHRLVLVAAGEGCLLKKNRIEIAITFMLVLTFSQGNINIAITTAILIATMLMITFQEPRMKTPAVKSARMPAQRMKGFQLSKFAACKR